MAVTKVMKKGQLVIPKEVRDVTGLNEGDRIIVEARDRIIVIEKVPTWKEMRGSLRELLKGVAVQELLKEPLEIEEEHEAKLQKL